MKDTIRGKIVLQSSSTYGFDFYKMAGGHQEKVDFKFIFGIGGTS